MAVSSPVPFSCFSSRTIGLGADVARELWDGECRNAATLAKALEISVAEVHEAVSFLLDRNISITTSGRGENQCFQFNRAEHGIDIDNLTLGELVDLGVLAPDDVNEYMRRWEKQQACHRRLKLKLLR